MVTYKTPNVYVEEISIIPPSVAQVATGIPAFIGYTEKAEKDGEDLTNKPTRISSILDYETLFGKAYALYIAVYLKDGEIYDIVAGSTDNNSHLMYYIMRFYFDNGGGPCYIVSVGRYAEIPRDKARFEAGLLAIEKEDEPTLILLTDAVYSIGIAEADYYDLCQQALEQCNKLKDRFAIFDVLQDLNATEDRIIGGVTNFRNGIGTNHLKYGAAYYPYLQTSLNCYYTDESVHIYSGYDPDIPPSQTLRDIKSTNTELYNKIKTELDKRRIVLPPSAALAGVYAKVDRDRGVWKAPANVSLASVLGPIIKINNEDQEDLNVDTTGGKSINAIRSFTGKGTLVWGARTLAGNDNEWRYIPVRRLFNMIEESIQKSIAFVVFESNNAITWLKVKSMIDSYLEGLWRQGALAGTAPEEVKLSKPISRLLLYRACSSSEPDVRLSPHHGSSLKRPLSWAHPCLNINISSTHI